MISAVEADLVKSDDTARSNVPRRSADESSRIGLMDQHVPADHEIEPFGRGEIFH
jgi:hypothetical protein